MSMIDGKETRRVLVDMTIVSIESPDPRQTDLTMLEVPAIERTANDEEQNHRGDERAGVFDPDFRLNAPCPDDGDEEEQLQQQLEAAEARRDERLLPAVVAAETTLPDPIKPLPVASYSGRQSLSFSKSPWMFIVFILQTALLLGAIIAIICLAVALRQSSKRNGTTGKDLPPGSPDQRLTVSTLNNIRARGNLRCGVVEYPGFSTFNNATGEWSGFEVDLCRAVGASIFGEDGHVQFIPLSNSERFIVLQSTQVDLLAAGVTYTMERDLYESTSEAGFSFSAPYLYNGLGFAGQPPYVQCAESFKSSGNCSNLTICVQAPSTSHVDFVQKHFPVSAITLAPTRYDFYNLFAQGQCNVLAGEQFDLATAILRKAGYTGGYNISGNLHSKEPIALVTRDDDVTWSDYVNWVFLALLTAENRTITQAIAQSVIERPAQSVDVSETPFYHVVATVGNYAEMYARHLQSIVPRAPVNQQNDGTSPLMYSFPFGNIATFGPGPELVTGGTLKSILDRGELRCGIGSADFFSKFDPFTQQWRGFDVEFCRAVSAAIFNGIGSTRFIQVEAKERFEALANGTIDLLVRATGVNYERDIKEKQTNIGFTFHPANFFTGLRFGGFPTYADCANRVDVLSSQCKSLKICVNEGTTNIANARKLFADKFIVAKRTEVDVYECLETREANAIGGFSIFNATVGQYFNGTYIEGTKLFSRDNLAPVTNQDDPQWSSFVTWIMHALYYAEEQNITQATYYKMSTVNLFGPSFSNMFQNVIQAVGSYGEIFHRAAGSQYQRTALNNINIGNGPLHYPPPGIFGHY